MKKTKWITIRISQEEKKALKEDYKKQAWYHSSFSEYIRRLIIIGGKDNE